MSQTRTSSRSWVLIVGLVLAVAGIATAVTGFLSASAAETDRIDAERAVAAVEEAIGGAEADLADAEATLEATHEAKDEATAELAATEEERDRLRAELTTLENQAPDFVAATTDLLATAGETEAAVAALVARRRAQAEALAGDDFATFNDRLANYAQPAAQAAAQLTGFFSQAEGLPAVNLRDPYRYDGPPGEEMGTSEPARLEPPSGPAQVEMTLPEQVACTPFGNGGCKYSWEAKITESNWLEVTITRIGVRYRGGGGYCVVGDEWSDVTRVVPADGNTTWSGSLIEDRDGECAPVLGGDLLVRWEGTDAEGHSLSGRATADLASPP